MTANIWHSCSNYPLSYHFKGKDPIVREIFDAYLELIESFGPVTVIPQKTRIAFQGRVRFAGAVTRKHWLDCALWLKRRAEHPKFYKVERLGATNHIYNFRLSSVDDLQDQELRDLLKEDTPSDSRRSKSRELFADSASTVLRAVRCLSYNAFHQPTVLAIAQRLPAAFIWVKLRLTFSRQRRLFKVE